MSINDHIERVVIHRLHITLICLSLIKIDPKTRLICLSSIPTFCWIRTRKEIYLNNCVGADQYTGAIQILEGHLRSLEHSGLDSPLWWASTSHLEVLVAPYQFRGGCATSSGHSGLPSPLVGHHKSCWSTRGLIPPLVSLHESVVTLGALHRSSGTSMRPSWHLDLSRRPLKSHVKLLKPPQGHRGTRGSWRSSEATSNLVVTICISGLQGVVCLLVPAPRRDQSTSLISSLQHHEFSSFSHRLVATVHPARHQSLPPCHPFVLTEQNRTGTNQIHPPPLFVASKQIRAVLFRSTHAQHQEKKKEGKHTNNDV